MDGSLKGRLLIAAPSLYDFFRRAVILMVEHNDEGAFGVVLNRPSETTIGEAVPTLAEVADPEDVVRIGGPVGAESVVLLGEFEEPEDSPKIVVGNVGVVDPGEASALDRVRVYAGHSGWGPGQLESELEQEAWLVESARPGDPFRDDDLWVVALNRRGGDYALLATMPEDPSLN